MIKEHEQAIKTLEEFIDHFQVLIKQADKANDEAFDREKAEQDIKDFQIAIQAIEWLNDLKDLVIDLTREKNDLFAELENLKTTYRNKIFFDQSWIKGN